MKSKELKRSTGKVRDNRSGKNCKRRGKAIINPSADDGVRRGALHRWPTKDQEAMYFDMNTSKNPVNRPSKGRIRPPVTEFALLESLDPATLDKLLTAASFSVKKIKRYPGWILQRVYNLKSRPIQII